jgi:hypothetical protein
MEYKLPSTCVGREFSGQLGFFKGIDGLRGHMGMSHKGRKWDKAVILEHCVYKELTAKEVKLVKQGGEGKYIRPFASKFL